MTDARRPRSRQRLRRARALRRARRLRRLWLVPAVVGVFVVGFSALPAGVVTAEPQPLNAEPVAARSWWRPSWWRRSQPTPAPRATRRGAPGPTVTPSSRPPANAPVALPTTATTDPRPGTPASTSSSTSPAPTSSSSKTPPTSSSKTTPTGSSPMTPTSPSATAKTSTGPAPSSSASAPANPPAPAPSNGAPAGRTRITPEQFGANGTDSGDDTLALQRAFDAAGPTSYVEIAAGRTYRHNAVLTITKPGTWVRGPGTILATNEEQAAIFADARDVTFDGGLTIGLTAWTVRHLNWETFGVRSLNTSGLTMRDVTLSELELFLQNSSDFTISRVTVKHSQADGIHMTGGSRNGTVSDVTTIDTGDDGVAVVSYAKDGAPCSNITVTRPRVLGTRWGRGISVIGGTDITYADAYVERTSAAGIIVAAESSYVTMAPRRVRVLGATVVQANHGTPVHGAVLVHSDRPASALGGQSLDDVLIRDVTIKDTNPIKGYNVRVNTDAGATASRVVLDRIAINGGPATALLTDQRPPALTTSGWTENGRAIAV